VITIGIDPHKDTHTAAAVDDSTGQWLGELTVVGTEEGHGQLLAWAHGLAPGGQKPRFALEDCRHVNGRLERFLLAAGEVVLRVGTRMTARARRNARTAGKSDAIDALAVARAALREPVLPLATNDPELRELKLLVDHRSDRRAHRPRDAPPLALAAWDGSPPTQLSPATPAAPRSRSPRVGPVAIASPGSATAS
jgi:transposase